MHTLLLCDTPDSEGQAYGRSIRYPPFLRKCTLNITVCKWNVESMNFQGSRFMRLSQHNKSDCVCAERVWALPVPVPPPEHKPVVGDPWLFWFSYLLILVGGIGPFPTVINEAQEKKKREMALSQLCLQFKNDLHRVPNVWFISFALLPFRNLSSCHQIISVLSVWFQALCLSSPSFLQSIPKCHLDIHLCTTWCFCESNQPLLVSISLILITC